MKTPEGDTRETLCGNERHIKPLYVIAHLNGRPVSKVLIDNGSAVNLMPLRMLRALGRSISDLI